MKRHYYWKVQLHCTVIQSLHIAACNFAILHARFPVIKCIFHLLIKFFTIIYRNMATLVVVGEVGDYGSTQEGLRGVPSEMLDHTYHTTNSKHPSSPSSWNTKKAVVLGIIGLAAAVVSGATLFLSVLGDSSSGPARTEVAFLLHDGRLDAARVPASGAWPIDGLSFLPTEGGLGFGHPYITCYSTPINSGYAQQFCWSKTYNWGGINPRWYPCTPQGYGRTRTNTDLCVNNVRTF